MYLCLYHSPLSSKVQQHSTPVPPRVPTAPRTSDFGPISETRTTSLRLRLLILDARSYYHSNRTKTVTMAYLLGVVKDIILHSSPHPRRSWKARINERPFFPALCHTKTTVPDLDLDSDSDSGDRASRLSYGPWQRHRHRANDPVHG